MFKIAAIACVIVPFAIAVYTMQEIKKETKTVETVKTANVYCADGSKWNKIDIVYHIGSYDLYRNSKWVARVPSGMCALSAVE